MKITILKTFLLLFILISNLSPYCQEVSVKLKADFFRLQAIDTDSALLVVDKIILSQKPVDRAFGLSAKLYLLARQGDVNEEVERSIPRINKFVDRVAENSVEFTDLTNSYNLLGAVFSLKRQFDRALACYISAYEYATRSNDIAQQIKIQGNIAQTKINIGDFRNAIKDIRDVIKLIHANKEIYEQFQYDLLINNNYLNLGQAYAEQWQLKENISMRDSAIFCYNFVQESSQLAFQLGQVKLKLGTIYNKSKEYELAEQNYKEGIALFESQGAIYEVMAAEYNLAVNQVEKDENKQAKDVLLGLIEKHEDLDYYDDNYTAALSLLSKIYMKWEVSDSAAFYLDAYTEISNEQLEQEKETFSKTYELVHENDNQQDVRELEKEVVEEREVQFYIISAAGLTVLLVVFILFFQYRKKKEVQRKYDQFMKSIEEKKKGNKTHLSTGTTSLSQDQLDKILKGLNKIEERHVYLKTTFTNYEAAKYIGTNSKYLTKVLKEVYETSFTDYLNELRINYIIEALQNEKGVRNYTTQALAEKVGYKNGVSFSRIFKARTGISPYQFVKKIEHDSQK